MPDNIFGWVRGSLPIQAMGDGASPIFTGLNPDSGILPLNYELTSKVQIPGFTIPRNVNFLEVTDNVASPSPGGGSGGGSSRTPNPWLANQDLPPSEMDVPYSENAPFQFFLERADQGTLQQSETQNNNPVDRSSSGANSIYDQLSSPNAVTGSSLNFSELGELKISSMQNFVSKNIAGPVDPDAPTRLPNSWGLDPDAPRIRLPDSWPIDPGPNAPPIPPNAPIELKTDKKPDIDPSDLNSPYGSKKESKGSLSGQEDFPIMWKFITAPRDISWSKDGNVSSSDVYGTNQPFQIYAFTSLRKLSLSDCLVEGFTENRRVEEHILDLEKLMKVQINQDSGFASPYIWRLTAGPKLYGFFLITSLNIKEEQRDFKGRATRSRVDISLQEVPEFQVNNGRDLASKGELVKVDESLFQKEKPEVESKEGTKPDGTTEADGSKVTDTSTGVASWYGGNGDGFAGRKTANGETFDPNKRTAAHKTLPFGTRVRVTNLATGKSTIVRINDRGPFVGGRSIDLSRSAAEDVGMIQSGVADVKLEVLGN